MLRSRDTSTLSKRIQGIFWGPQILAFLPALSLGTYWMIGEGGLIACALGLPVLWAMFGGFSPQSTMPVQAAPQVDSTQIDLHIEHLIKTASPDEKFALFAIQIDEASDIIKRLSNADLGDIQTRLELRYESSLRSSDLVVRQDDLAWMIAISAGPNLDLEACIQQASRLQAIVDEPFFLGDERLYLSGCIGFTISDHASDSAEALIERAQAALADAAHNGPDAIRAYSAQTPRKNFASSDAPITLLEGDIETCLAAWFQPQISTDTGQICGFEALARWQCPDGTWLPPASFLPILERAGQMERLTELMLAKSLQALTQWDDLNLNIDTIGVNFSEVDLANPKLFEKIAWDLDRFNIAPHRLCVEILESVIAGDSNDIIVRSVAQLADFGCQIDLDDFGTGHASISSLRRLPVNRLEIDRSFVAKADLDSEQQKMVATILMMADRLGLSCLAEGVETLGEHTILAQLGCRYVQGFGIAKPMPLEQTFEWITDYQAKFVATPEIGGKRS